MPDQSQPAIETIRDIHIPEAVSGWPPPLALLASALAVLAIIAIVHLLRKAFSQKSINKIGDRQFTMLLEQAELSPLARVQKSCQLMREICISYYPRAEVASMTGQHWVDFLNKATPNEKLFNAEMALLLTEAPYRNLEVTTEQAEQLITCCRSWLNCLPVKRL